MCPNKCSQEFIVKNGFYKRPSDQLKIQRYQCKKCHKTFSNQTHSFNYRLRKRRINQMVFRLLAKGVSERGSAQILSVKPQTIARRVRLFGRTAAKHLKQQQDKVDRIESIVFDEMESFEHTKLKPLTIPIAVEQRSRKILALDVGEIAAKGHLAVISRKKYGRRRCQRKLVLHSLFGQIHKIASSHACFTSDESTHYPKLLRLYFPHSKHITFKGSGATIAGQGEMKKGGFDPLFCFNQTAAMIRDNVKRMTRRTWCTTKKVAHLKDFLHLYAFYHNQRIDGVRRPRLFDCPINN